MNEQNPVEAARQDIFAAALDWHHVTTHPVIGSTEQVTQRLHEAIDNYLTEVDRLIGRIHRKDTAWPPRNSTQPKS